MRYKAKYTRADYAHGTTRLKRAFAWIPVYINGENIWLENYEILQAYLIKELSLKIEGKDKPVFFSSGKWVNVSKRIL